MNLRREKGPGSDRQGGARLLQECAYPLETPSGAPTQYLKI